MGPNFDPVFYQFLAPILRSRKSHKTSVFGSGTYLFSGLVWCVLWVQSQRQKFGFRVGRLTKIKCRPGAKMYQKWSQNGALNRHENASRTSSQMIKNGTPKITSKISILGPALGVRFWPFSTLPVGGFLGRLAP